MSAPSPVDPDRERDQRRALADALQHCVDLAPQREKPARVGSAGEGSEVNVLEVGVYGGGSLEMWRDYFGPKCMVFGVDIKEACKTYENEYTKILIGNQGDRRFSGTALGTLSPRLTSWSMMVAIGQRIK
jgi:hypothetical protein